MSTASDIADRPSTKRKPPKPNPFGEQLLALVRKLIICGQELLDSLKTCEGPHPPLETFRRFGCLSLKRVIARITRGLIIAGVLEERFLRRLPRKEERPKRDSIPRPPAPKPDSGQPKPRRSLWTSHEEELDGPLPSAEAIAERLRGRPAGAVITEICRDLGINTRHPLWRELNELLRWCHPYNLWRMMEAWRERGTRLAAADPTLGSEMGIYPPPAAATHPP